MSRHITIPLSDALEADLAALAKDRGAPSLDECVLALLTEALALPRASTNPSALEAQLLEGLDGAGRSPTADEWTAKKADLAARHARSKAG